MMSVELNKLKPPPRCTRTLRYPCLYRFHRSSDGKWIHVCRHPKAKPQEKPFRCPLLK